MNEQAEPMTNTEQKKWVAQNCTRSFKDVKTYVGVERPEAPHELAGAVLVNGTLEMMAEFERLKGFGFDNPPRTVIRALRVERQYIDPIFSEKESE